MEHIAGVVARWWSGVTPGHVEARDRMKALGLVSERCCDGCPFESIKPSRLVSHRAYCETFGAMVMRRLAGMTD